MSGGVSTFLWMMTRRHFGQHSQILNEIQHKGFYVVPKFLTRDECESTIAHLETLFESHQNKVRETLREDTFGDSRVYGAEYGSELVAKKVKENEWLRQMACRYAREDLLAHFVLGNKVSFVEGTSRNSGGGWHRDMNKLYRLKSIVYLNDVDETNGPFMMIEKSARLKLTPRDENRRKRYTDEIVEEYRQSNPARVHEIHGEAGTCILADTSNIHRGKNIEAGVRYALTNYYFADTPSRWRKTGEAWGEYLLDPEARKKACAHLDQVEVGA